MADSKRDNKTLEKVSINGKTFFFNMGETATGKYLTIHGYAKGGKDHILVFENQLDAFVGALRRCALKIQGQVSYDQVVHTVETKEVKGCPGYESEEYREAYKEFNDEDLSYHEPVWQSFTNELGTFKICTVCGWEEAPDE